MRRGARLALSTLLVVAGLAFLAFFGLLLGVADCTLRCQERGERAPVFAFLGAGTLLVVWGLRGRAGALHAIGEGMLAGGAVALAGAAWVLAQGAGGAPAYVTLAIALGALAVGAWLRFLRFR